MKKFFALALALVMALSLTTMAWGADVSYTVDSSNPVSATNFHTLEDAVAAVNAGDNATITLLEDVELATMLVVNVAANITIDGNGNEITTSTSFASDYVLHLCGPAANTYKVVDVTFNTCEANIAIVKVEPATAYFDCDFTACEAQTMIYAKNADATLDGCNFTGNTSNYVSGGNFALVTLFCPAVVSDCVFTGNTAYTNGMVYFKYSPVAEATNNVFENNVIENTVQNAAVIYADELTASGNTFEDNEVSAPNRAAVVVADMGEVSDNVFSGNDVDGADGKTATVVAKGDPDTDLDVSGNYWDGGAPDVANDGDCDVVADTYYTTAVGGALGGLIYTATGTPDATLDKKATSYDNLYAKSTTLPATAPTTEVDIVVTPAKAVKYNKTTGYIDDVGNVEYVNITGDATYYMFVNTLAEADVVLYKDAAGKQVKFYLDEIETPYYVEGVAFANFGEKCGQVDYDEDDGYDKTLKYFTVKGLNFFDVFEEAEVGAYNDGYVMYNGKLVPVVGLGVDKVPHTAIYTTKNGVVESIECGACGLKAVKVPNALSMPKGADVVDGETVWYWPSATASTPSTDKTVQSAQTFDAGIAMYVGMSVMAAAGGAVVIGKKKD